MPTIYSINFFEKIKTKPQQLKGLGLETRTGNTHPDGHMVADRMFEILGEGGFFVFCHRDETFFLECLGKQLGKVEYAVIETILFATLDFIGRADFGQLALIFSQKKSNLIEGLIVPRVGENGLAGAGMFAQKRKIDTRRRLIAKGFVFEIAHVPAHPTVVSIKIVHIHIKIAQQNKIGRHHVFFGLEPHGHPARQLPKFGSPLFHGSVYQMRVDRDKRDRLGGPGT